MGAKNYYNQIFKRTLYTFNMELQDYIHIFIHSENKLN